VRDATVSDDRAGFTIVSPARIDTLIQWIRWSAWVLSMPHWEKVTGVKRDVQFTNKWEVERKPLKILNLLDEKTQLLTVGWTVREKGSHEKRLPLCLP
jgi:hypothetical protein